MGHGTRVPRPNNHPKIGSILPPKKEEFSMKMKKAKKLLMVNFYPKKGESTGTLSINDLDMPIKDLGIEDYTLNELLHGGIEFCEYDDREKKYIPFDKAILHMTNREKLKKFFSYSDEELEEMTDDDCNEEWKVVCAEAEPIE